MGNQLLDETRSRASDQNFLAELETIRQLDSATHDPRTDQLLKYDTTIWQERVAEPQNTLQIFVTDVCNLRCKECFYANWLGKSQMTFEQYRAYVLEYRDQVQKVTLLGGEPTLHRELPDLVRFNASLGLRTTIYTNGIRVQTLASIIDDPALAGMVSIRIGVHGLSVNPSNDKPLITVKPTELPVTIVYMLAPYNAHELMAAAYYAETHFNCQGFYISSIRELDRTGDFWKDTERTIQIAQYARIIQSFVRNYRGSLRFLHLATRGVLVTRQQNFETVTRCRFGSILGDGTFVIAPLDISLNIAAPRLVFDKQPCSRHHKCVLQKIVLERK